MNTRRNFILHSSMAATALLAAKPFKAIAKGNHSLIQFTNRQNCIVFLHTAGLQAESHSATLQFISAIQRKTANAILLDAGHSDSTIAFDVSVHDDAVLAGGDYRIIKKGGISTGLITITKNEDRLIEKVNQLASLLKKDKNCKVVVCISQIGFSHKDRLDDKDLAAQSKNIDIIIGAHPHNYAARPLTLPNSSKQEVVIQSAAASQCAFGKIEIGFDAHGNKNHVHILHKVPAKEGQQTAIIAA